MSFRFKRQEPVGDGFRRIAGTEFHAVQRLLQRTLAGPQQDQAIHDARRHLKKLRALLRLFREPLGKDFCADQIHALGAVADRLAPARDARVRLAALNAIAKEAGPACATAVAKIRRSYAAQLQGSAQDSLDSQSVAELKDQLTATLAALAAAPLKDKDWALLADGVRRMCRRLRKAHAAAQKEGGTTAFHDWRKRAKDMQYQMRLVRGLCPQEMKRLDRRLDRLNEILGDDHDMALLEASLRGKPPSFRRSASAIRLLETIAARRHRMQRRAMRLGEKLLPEKPQAFTQRLADQWHAWRKG